MIYEWTRVDYARKQLCAQDLWKGEEMEVNLGRIGRKL